MNGLLNERGDRKIKISVLLSEFDEARFNGRKI